LSEIVEIENYNPLWEQEFHDLRKVIKAEVGQLILSVEHIGSTSINGLSAKPIIDIDIVIEDYSILRSIVQGLEKIGYYHQQDWSFKGREAFGRINTLVPWHSKNKYWMEHHLYVCNRESEELARHLAFRNYLRNHSEAVIAYEQLKKELAMNAVDRAAYSLGKTDFVNQILKDMTKRAN